MYFFYNLGINLYGLLLIVASMFSKKAHLLVQGRRHWRSRMRKIDFERPIWVHVASLGEFEQGRPIIESLKHRFPDVKIILTFYSPSGYEIRKNYPVADWVFYLPLDSRSNAKSFIRIVRPRLVVFVKYEFWPNFLREIKRAGVQSVLVSGIFRKNQMFFKWKNNWYSKVLKKIDYFFVQDENSKRLLRSIGVDSVEIAGDTRFDRVYDISKSNNTLDFVEEFKGSSNLMVLGSTWPEDDFVYVNPILEEKKLKYIIAPHNISSDYMQMLLGNFGNKAVLYSHMEGKDLSKFRYLILDTIGILTKVYSYADIAYVGGGFGNAGLHNILEPLIFNIPVLIGPNFEKFREAVILNQRKGIIVVNNEEEFENRISDFRRENFESYLKIANNFVQEEIGATRKIVNYLANHI